MIVDTESKQQVLLSSYVKESGKEELTIVNRQNGLLLAREIAGQYQTST